MTPVIEPAALCVNVHGAARMLGVSAWSVREYIATGALPTVKLPSTKGSRRALAADAGVGRRCERVY